jgi:hypothetical protein
VEQSGRDRVAMTTREIVRHGDIVALLEKHSDSMRTYIAGAAGDQDSFHD